ncbi:MAG: putative membrane protein [Beijerinckiaceae bacterium]|nr:MAG: putative membrane protein [Beijerinckiaceae bacterium]
MALMVGIEHLFGNLEPFIHAYGAVAVTVILAFESLGAPVPGESLLIFASVLAGRGELSLPLLMLGAWAGAVLGDNIGYLIGRRLGRTLVLRYGGKIGINAERLNWVEALFARYGPITVAFARFLNVLRQLNGVVAGMLKMEWKRFLLFNALGGALWVSVWTLAGFYLGEHVSDVKVIAHDLEHAGAILGAGVLIAALFYVFWRLRHAS